MVLGGALISCIWAVVILLFLEFKFSHSSREWHALEHKSIMLLEERLLPSAHNLSKCPQELLGCGTSLILIILQALSFSWLTLFIVLISSNLSGDIRLFLLSVALLLILIVISILTLINMVIRAGKTSDFSKLIKLKPLFWPGLFLPIMAQRFCSTKEPSSDKIEMTVEKLNEFLSEYRKEANGDLQNCIICQTEFDFDTSGLLGPDNSIVCSNNCAKICAAIKGNNIVIHDKDGNVVETDLKDGDKPRRHRW